MRVSTITPLIGLFNACPEGTNANTDDVKEILLYAIKKGYLIDPSCINAYSRAFLDSVDMQYNSTFYQTWADVKNRSRFEIFIDQIIHYCTSGFEDQYIPNCEPNEPAWNTYKVIRACTFAELYEKCMGMLSSGIALKSETVKYLTDYIVEYARENRVEVVVDSIKNREALVIICDALGVLPNDGAKLFAHIMYKTTGKTMIVKNRETRKTIHRMRDNTEMLWYSLNEKQLIALAGVFNRYKQLFLAFKNKHNSRINNVINKIGRLSKTHHKPMVRGFWETVLGTHHSADEIARQAESATNYKLIQVMQSIRERMLTASGLGDNMYVIRNGKVFFKENEYNAIDSRYFYWEEIYDILKNQLIKNLSAKKCAVKFPTKFELVCPTSEKNFIGNIPMGTSCPLGQHSVFGIYWKDEWGTYDFDLSYQDVNGNRIGWNSAWCYGNENDKEVIYSGDITRAPKGANECIYIAKNAPDGIIYVNRYNGRPNSKYKLFFGHEASCRFDTADMTKPYMTNRNKISIESEVTQDESTQQMVGIVFDDKMHFVTLSCGYDRVASAIYHAKRNCKKSWSTADIVDMLKKKSHSAIPIKEILLAAGFWEAEKDETPTIDLTDLDRSTLINLFDKE